jgi:hypothetical protein
MNSYILNERYKLPSIVVSILILLWIIVISFTAIPFSLLLYTTVTGQRTDSLPYAALALIGLFAVFAVIASLILYAVMWVYWFVAERSSAGIRLSWFLVLLFGIHYGAAIYAFKVWRKNLTRIPGRESKADTAPTI